MQGLETIFENIFLQFESKGFLYQKQLVHSDETTMFMKSLHYKLNPDVCKLIADLGNTTLDVRCTAVLMGKTSLTVQFVFSVRNEKLNGILAVRENTAVLIDRKTRRPSPFPQWFIEQYNQNNVVGVVPGLVRRKRNFIPPVDAFTVVMRARHSDCDDNFHVNTKVYYAFCHDAATEAAIAGYYRHYETDMCWFPVTETEMTYLSECLPGKDISVSTWQDKEDFRRLCFSLRQNDKLVFQASFVFDSVQYNNSSKI